MTGKEESDIFAILPCRLLHLPRKKSLSRRGKRAKAYALKVEQLPQMAAEELTTLEEFWVKKGREAKRARRGEKHIRSSTFKDVKEYHILCFYGWYVNIEGHSLDKLRLSLLTDISLIEKHIDWLVDARKCNHSAGTKVTQTAISVANQRGQVCLNVKKSVDGYIGDLEKKQRRLQHRLETLEIARSNFTAHNCLFFMLGSRGDCLESFGKPFNDENFCSMVTNAVEFATQALFAQPRRTNPHAFRHIGDKHVRKMKNGKTKAFDQLIGHAEQMGDDYAEQILSEFDQTSEVVDNWWEESDSDD